MYCKCRIQILALRLVANSPIVITKMNKYNIKSMHLQERTSASKRGLYNWVESPPVMLNIMKVMRTTLIAPV